MERGREGVKGERKGGMKKGREGVKGEREREEEMEGAQVSGLTILGPQFCASI